MQKHLKKFNHVENKSQGALSVFVQTMEKLKSDNEELASLHSEVSNDIESLSELKETVAQRFAKNLEAINGITQLLDGNK